MVEETRVAQIRLYTLSWALSFFPQKQQHFTRKKHWPACGNLSCPSLPWRCRTGEAAPATHFLKLSKGQKTTAAPTLELSPRRKTMASSSLAYGAPPPERCSAVGGPQWGVLQGSAHQARGRACEPAVPEDCHLSLQCPS